MRARLESAFTTLCTSDPHLHIFLPCLLRETKVAQVRTCREDT